MSCGASSWADGRNHHQHGPVNELPQPYSYPYNMSDINDLVENLRKAVSHPIES